MAAPHVAGAVALLLEARPSMQARDVLGLLQRTADPHRWFGNPALGFLDNVHRQGAGMLDVVDALVSGTSLSPSRLALGEIESGAVTRRFTLGSQPSSVGSEAWGKTAITYTPGHEPALSTGANTFTPSFLSAFGSVSFSTPTVTVSGAITHASFDVTITPPANASARLFGGYITLTPNNDGPMLRVPYAGYNGDYQAIPVLVPTANNFPWLARLSGTTFTNQPAGAAFTLVGGDLPQIVVHLDHAVEKLAFEVYEVARGRHLGVFTEDRYLPRNSGATSFFAFPWDGTANGAALPNGTYQIRLSVLKALGSRDNQAHRESWASPNITIAPPTS